MMDGPVIVDLPSASRPVGQIQTDAFCEGCGYNLYTQAVTRDERLGLLVCRCPECGRYAVPGRATDAGRPWLQRLGAVLLVVYILFLLYGIGFGLAGLWAVHAAHLEDVERPVVVTRPGNMTAGIYSYRRSANFEADWMAMVLSAAVGYALGSFIAIFFCHWKRRAWLAVAIPLLLAVAVHFVWVRTSSGLTTHVERLGRWNSFQHATVQVAGLFLALLIARPVTRGFLRLMLARPLLPYFANLWLADDLKPPSAITNAEQAKNTFVGTAGSPASAGGVEHSRHGGLR